MKQGLLAILGIFFIVLVTTTVLYHDVRLWQSIISDFKGGFWAASITIFGMYFTPHILLAILPLIIATSGSSYLVPQLLNKPHAHIFPAVLVLFGWFFSNLSTNVFIIGNGGGAKLFTFVENYRDILLLLLPAYVAYVFALYKSNRT